MNNQTSTLANYEQKKAILIKQLRLALKNKKEGASIGIGGKKTSNLFRDRNQKETKKIDVKSFNQVIQVTPHKLEAEVEGMTPYEELVNATLEHNLLPTVVPQLKSITIGGAVTGVGIEASSYKYGFVHETIKEVEILQSSGKTVICSPHNQYKDLFFGFPNSYGTFGYALKLKVQLIPAKKYVKITHTHYHNAKDFFKDLKEKCELGKKQGTADFIDGVVFDENSLYITEGKFVDNAPYVSNYKYLNIYYQSIKKKKEDYLTTLDYIWRWDADWFWCSKPFGMQNLLMRLLLGKFCLKSTAYWRMKNFLAKYRIFALMDKIKGPTEAVVQDIEIPIEHCVQFLDFFHKKIGIKPIWICPVSAHDHSAHFTLYPMDSQKMYVNFGFWDAIKTTSEDGHYNRLIEQKVKELEGRKSLYSTSFYSKEEFWKLYNKDAYEKLKMKYDPDHVFRDLYTKCVLRR